MTRVVLRGVLIRASHKMRHPRSQVERCTAQAQWTCHSLVVAFERGTSYSATTLGQSCRTAMNGGTNLGLEWSSHLTEFRGDSGLQIRRDHLNDTQKTGDTCIVDCEARIPPNSVLW